MEDRLKQLIESISKEKFNIDKYRNFIAELLNLRTNEFIHKIENTIIKSGYKDYVTSYLELAKYTDRQREVISILAVKLEMGKEADNARTKQRNFIAEYLKDNGYDACLVAFYSEDKSNWRLSFVKVEGTYELGKFKQKVSPAKRYSYLFGEHEPNHTAKQQLSELIKYTDKKYTVQELEKVFTVEKVTKDFFEQYKKKYNELYDELEKNIYFKEESEKYKFSVEEFCKKLMGQLVFLYFIQKKGWLGVELVPKRLTKEQFNKLNSEVGRVEQDTLNKFYNLKDNNYYISSNTLYNCSKIEAEELSNIFVKTEYDKKWGTGKKDFMRFMFSHCKNNTNKNFYNDFLEPLFYEALNDARANQYYKVFNAKIPYLNGGLFEPIKNYRWHSTDFKISNDIFSNDDQTGILDFFDRYNFTIDEEEPMEKDVAVDPEMLGKIFENLLENKERKLKGAFYTPREIVHYMCQESLANYLVNKIGVEYEEIKEFILYGDILVSMDLAESNNISQSHLIGESALLKMYEIDKALNEVKIADPAVGSGAFPLGMLNEIVRLRQNATEYLRELYKKRMLDEEAQNHLITEGKGARTHYQYKWNAIENSIYAVDIEPSAVDITKLRLWLSLVVEQELKDGEEPHTLPNLDCKIMCGNSLIDEYKGIKLLDKEMLDTLEKEMVDHSPEENQMKDYIQISFEHNQKELPLRVLKEAKHKFYNATNSFDKATSKKTIIEMRKEYLSHCFKYAKSEIWNEFLEQDKNTKKEYFSWYLEFIEVFNENKGFDIVIGNPPYVQLQKFKGQNIQEMIKKQKYKVYNSNSDMYCLFYELSLLLTKNKGIACLITSNKWLTAGYGIELRKYFLNYNPKKLIDLGSGVFETATVDTNILLVSKESNQNKLIALKATSEERIDIFEQITEKGNTLKNLTENNWYIIDEETQKLKEKIDNTRTTIQDMDTKIYRGILTGLSEAFIIDHPKYQELVSQDPNSKDILKVLVKGRNIGRYSCKFDNKYIINTGFDLNIPEMYPKIFEHLKKFEEKAIKRGDKGKNWWNLRACSYYSEFKKIKLVWTPVNSEYKFTVLNEDVYFNNSLFMIISEYSYYLCGVFNSKLMRKYLTFLLSSEDNYTYASKEIIEKIPVPKVSENNKELVSEIERMVIQIIELKKNNGETLILEKKIDEIVYKLYNLTDQEIKIIEKDIK